MEGPRRAAALQAGRLRPAEKGYADPDGAYVTAYNNAFVPTYASVRLPAERYPTRFADYLKPAFKGKLVLTYPHDDDAVLYVYDKLERRYGSGFLRALAARKPNFLRGTAAPAASVGTDSIGSLGNLTGYATDSDTPAGYFVPTDEPFIVWNQRAAIFKAARHPATAKLLLSYLGSAEFQSSYGGWRARADVGEAPGLPPLESLKNVDVHDFHPLDGRSPTGGQPAQAHGANLRPGTRRVAVARPGADEPAGADGERHRRPARTGPADLLNRHDGLAHGRRGVVDPGELPIRFRRQAGGLEQLGRLPLLIKYF